MMVPTLMHSPALQRPTMLTKTQNAKSASTRKKAFESPPSPRNERHFGTTISALSTPLIYHTARGSPTCRPLPYHRKLEIVPARCGFQFVSSGLDIALKGLFCLNADAGLATSNLVDNIPNEAFGW